MIGAGQSIGSYRILQKIGTGGMGAVYLAEHPLIGKKVALKVIHRELASNKEVVQRFFQEAKAVTKIGNEHIIEIHDFGQTPEGDHFYIMEYLEGQTLAQALAKDSALGTMRALHIGAQVAAALAAAHAAGVIHRDLKPDNVMLTNRLGDPDFVVLLDFGLAKMFSGPGSPSAVKTAAGVLLGTPQYMSPEACESRGNIDHRTDVYALGILLFQMMTGMLPFDGETMGEVLVKQVTQLPPPPRGYNPSIPPSVEQIVLRCLAKNPDVRFPTMQALRDALLDPEAYLRNSPPVAPARSLAPGEVKVDAKTIMAYAAQEQATRIGMSGVQPVVQPPQMPGGGGHAARTMIADGSMVPPRGPSTGAVQIGQQPEMVAPVQPKMNTMRIATPVGYSSRPPRKMWPYVLVVALLLGGGGGAFAVAYFAREKTPAAGAPESATVATGTGSGSATPTGTGTATPAPGSATPAPTGSATPTGSAAVVTPPSAGNAGANDAGVTASAPADAAAANTASLRADAAAASGTTNTANVTPIETPAGSGSANVPMAVIVFDSTPQGAEVFGPDKKAYGKTPARISMPISDMPVEFELKLAGYRKKTKQLVVSGNTMVSVTLDRAPTQKPKNPKNTGGDGTELMRPD